MGKPHIWTAYLTPLPYLFMCSLDLAFVFGVIKSRSKKMNNNPFDKSAQIPLTVDRVMAFVQGYDGHFGLNFTSALVVPLQGFWNSAVYITTSPRSVKALFHKIWLWCKEIRFSRSGRNLRPQQHQG